MRFLPLFFRLHPALLAVLPLLAGCGKTAGPVRLDFVGAANLTSSNRTLGAADTVAVRLYAITSADEPLTRLTITTRATPRRQAFVYPTPLSSFRPETQPAGPEQVLLDSALAPNTRELNFQTTFTARPTTGTERWEFAVFDAAGHRASRAFRLTVRRPDSLALVQSYTLLLRPGRGPLARPYLVLDSGQVLPRYAARPSLPQNQQIIDLVALETPNGLYLAAPDAPAAVPLPARWPSPRATRLRPTAFDAAGFGSPTTATAFQDFFDAAQRYSQAGDYVTDALAKDQVIAFQTAGGHYGFLQIIDLIRTPYPLLKVSVRMAK